MSKVSCGIIKDLLPLYYDEVCCEESNTMVKEHLDECCSCKRELDTIKADIQLPKETIEKNRSDANAIKAISASWNRSKVKAFFKGTIGATVLIIIALTLVFGCYSQTHISIWGFNIPKNELKDVLINTKENNYIITNPQVVLELTKEVSKMKKLNKVEPSNFPPKETPTKFIKLMIQTDATYGGSFWQDGNNGVMLDSNGYYWSVSKELLEIMDKSFIEAKLLGGS